VDLPQRLSTELQSIRGCEDMEVSSKILDGCKYPSSPSGRFSRGTNLIGVWVVGSTVVYTVIRR